ncbi:gamma-tubulin complex, DGRIP91/SPC98 component protein [Macrolepiota fuliginosa MF-IS2]|uniref:Spindle pole body component n=1 Tax=Macrolepiota fuliginosa MF-IS2 TaxID=1400762 RepID=A0A9P5XBY8_9AGAR|nr:gamma-tubulin complex, DGRIP91/SPC98 component protein [Macrolepiota fuliginosa MF-IS2]
MAKRALDSPIWFRLNHDDLKNKVDGLEFNELPAVFPRFFVPSLQDKPQNPIIDSIKLSERNREPVNDCSKERHSLPPELHIITDDLVRLRLGDEGQAMKEGSVWEKLDVHSSNRKSQLLSWDALRPTSQQTRTSTPFLSERDSLVYASARHYVRPHLKDTSTHVVYVNQADLFSSLKMTVLGNSSVFHSWDAKSERFVQTGVGEGERGFLLLDGKDEVISNSVISRFLNIGNMLRRLEILLAGLRNNTGPTIHAFAHALSNVLDWLRKTLAKCPPSSAELAAGNVAISRVWLQYGLYQDTLTSLSELCGRGEEKVPQDYEHLNPNPINILSRIYTHLGTHIIQQSSRTITAIFAYILTCTSNEYLRQVSQSVGFGPQPPQRQERVATLALDEYTIDEDAEEGEEDIFEVLERIEDSYPSFFPPELLAILPAAQRSLILLKRARPDHPLLTDPRRQDEVRWLWRKEDIDAAYFKIQKFYHTQSSQTNDEGTYAGAPVQEYKPELEGLRIFDMEPGASTQNTPLVSQATASAVQDFIDSFPDSLSPIAPTFSHLSSIVFSNLLQHSSALSSTLLELFLDHPGELNLRSHLILLRDFLLITSPPFRLRLSAALFSDKEDYEIDNKNRTLSLQTIRQRKQIAESTQPWAVGLASALLEREIWPPVGADLSFFLRTVIVDSIEYPQGPSKIPKQVASDASWRLGFAIRDLPTGPGRDKWLNPLCVEALDFLYMDYKPPHPLEVLIPHEVLSKYQRMFTFLLRLIRVEHALHAVRRMMRCTITPVFPTLASARKLALHFRFVAQSFVNALSGYVFDTVIGGNFDPFLAELVPNHKEDDNQEHRRFSDVFELAKRHSDLLDDILSACLMRSGQRAAGDLLRQATEIVLEFAVVIGELRRGRLQEYEAAPMVEDAFAKFRNKMATLTKVLKGLVEKSSSKSYAEHFFAGQRNLPGGLEALHHLLLRIDMSDWWSMSPQ